MTTRTIRSVAASPAALLFAAVVAASGYACSGSLGGVGGKADQGSGDCTGGDCGGPGGSPGPGGGGTSGMGVGDPSTPDGVGISTQFAKLSNNQWENTVRDLFFLSGPTGLSSNFVEEPGDQGYEAESAAPITIAGDSWGRYQTAAEAVAAQVTGDATKLAKITPTTTGSDDKPTAFVKSFVRRAYRRALSDQEVAAYVALFKQGPTLVGGDSFAAGASLVIQSVLQSPYFLYRAELSSTAGDDGKIPLSGDEVAVRLSYTLWDTMPSDDLFTAAEGGELATKDGVKSWATKMLADPRAEAMLLAFHTQTFQIQTYGTQQHDPSLGFDATALAPILQQEASLFFQDVVVQNDGGIRQLLTTPAAYMNESTAKFYEVDGVSGQTMVRKDLDTTRRAGFLTQVGYLSTNASNNMSDPVHRGLGVLRKVLCDSPNPPPAAFTPPSPVTGQTTRQIYEQKTTPCGNGCHNTLINPPGFAFEHFDAVGKWRETENGLTIDASDTMVVRDGWTAADKASKPGTSITFNGAADLSKQLAELPRVHECYGRRWIEFALARPVDPVEQGAGEALRETSMKSNSPRDIILQLVTLDTFLTRAPGAQ